MLLKLIPWFRGVRKYSYEIGQMISEGPELIHPLVWKNAAKINKPSSNFVETLEEETRKRLDFIRKEVEVNYIC